MIEDNLDKIVNENSDLVELIEKLEISEEEEISKLKAKLMAHAPFGAPHRMKIFTTKTQGE